MGALTCRQVVTLGRKVTNHTAYLGNIPLVVSVSVLAGWLAGWLEAFSHHLFSPVRYQNSSGFLSPPRESSPSSYLRNYQVPLPSLQFPLTQQAPFAGHHLPRLPTFLVARILYATVVNTVYTVIVNECLWKLCPTLRLRNPFLNVLNCLGGNCLQ